MKLTLILETEEGQRGLRGKRADVRAAVSKALEKDAVGQAYALARIDGLPESVDHIYADVTANWVTNEKTGDLHSNVQVVIQVW